MEAESPGWRDGGQASPREEPADAEVQGVDELGGVPTGLAGGESINEVRQLLDGKGPRRVFIHYGIVLLKTNGVRGILKGFGYALERGIGKVVVPVAAITRI